MASGPTYVFAGPTLRPEDIHAILPDAVCHPPVAQGDVYRALQRQPDAIGIIDGFFDTVPAVWHKEILFALDAGVAVFGAASMGALRAAELDAFGMIGVGDIYQNYCDGVLEDDDEVAISHATADDGFREFSDAMVNIRATTRAAEDHGVISASTRTLIDTAAKTLFYPDRTFAAAAERAKVLGADCRELDAFRKWLPDGKVNLKRADALRMLTRMRAPRDAEPPRFRFEHTVFFAELTASAPWDTSVAAALTSGHSGVLDEVRLQPEVWRQTLQGATLRVLADRDAEARGLHVSDEALVDATLKFRRERDLHDSADLIAWMERSDVDGKDFVALMENETRLGWLLASQMDEALARVPDELRATGRFAALRRRAQEKERAVDPGAFALVTLEHLELSEADLWTWYFECCVGHAVPGDISAHAQAVGFTDVEAFRRAVMREYLFTTRENVP